MISKLLIKRFLIVIMLATRSLAQPFFYIKKPTITTLIQENIKDDPCFRLCLGKAAIANLANAHTAYQNEKKLKSVGNIALAGIAAYTLCTYPSNGVWPIYTRLMSQEQLTALKVATGISIINIYKNGLTSLDKDRSFINAFKKTNQESGDSKTLVLLEAALDTACCVLPLYSLCEFWIKPSLDGITVGFSFIR